MMSDRIVTCVYCGHEYPDGTPTSQDEKLTEHIKVCEKHPMRGLEQQIARLNQERQRDALDGQAALDEANNRIAELEKDIAAAKARVAELEYTKMGGATWVDFSTHMRAMNKLKQISDAVARLIDESERIYWENKDDGKEKLHLKRAIDIAKAELEAKP